MVHGWRASVEQIVVRRAGEIRGIRRTQPEIAGLRKGSAVAGAYVVEKNIIPGINVRDVDCRAADVDAVGLRWRGAVEIDAVKGEVKGGRDRALKQKSSRRLEE